MHIISFASYDKCTVALREHSCKSQSEARTLDWRQRDRRKMLVWNQWAKELEKTGFVLL